MTQLSEAIRDVRAYIAGLRAEEKPKPGLRSGLAALAKQIESNSSLRVELDLDAEAEGMVGAAAAEQLDYVAREATSNIVRHTRATRADPPRPRGGPGSPSHSG
jgi:signal transduction histidine kinase